MKKVWNTLIFAFFIFCMFLVRPRQDIVFGAVERSQYIRLFENGRDFELCMKENQTFIGTYTITRDTVFLSYLEHLDQAVTIQNPGKEDSRLTLPTKLHINTGASNIVSSEGDLFSAQIYLDERQKSFQAAPDKTRMLKNSKVNILASGALDKFLE